MFSLRVGDEVPIFIQLEDGATDQFPRVLVRDPSDVLLQTVDLSHAANGLYTPGTAYVMPDEDYIRLSAIIYSDSGHTTENTAYGRTAESYYKNLDASQASVSALSIPTASQNADAVWDEALSGHTTVGSAGEAQNIIDDIETDIASIPTNPLLTNDARLDNLDAAISSVESEASAASRQSALISEHDTTQAAIAALSIPTVGDVADAVWDEALSGHVTAGTAGEAQNRIDDIETDVAAIPTNPLLTNDARLDNLDASVSSRESESDASTRQTALIAEHDTTQAAIAALDIPTVVEIADQVWDEALSGHLGAGSTGEALSSASTGSSPSAIADAVLDEIVSAHTTAGSVGAVLLSTSSAVIGRADLIGFVYEDSSGLVGIIDDGDNLIGIVKEN